MEQPPGRRGRRKDTTLVERRRNSLLTAAASIFAKRGFPEADVQEIADSCGVAKGTVYTYFPSKEELFLATVDMAMRRLNDRIEVATAELADPLDRLEVVARTYFTYFRDNPDHAELLITERAEYRDRKTPTYLEHRQKVCDKWSATFADLVRAGRIREMPGERVVRVMSDLLYGTMFTDHFSGRKRTPEEQAEDVIDIIFHGILTPEERLKRDRVP